MTLPLSYFNFYFLPLIYKKNSFTENLYDNNFVYENFLSYLTYVHCDSIQSTKP